MLWSRWVVANGVAELVGLTSTMALAAGAFSVNDSVSLGVGLLIAVAAVGAVVEGVAVGGLQWRVAHAVTSRLRSGSKTCPNFSVQHIIWKSVRPS